MDDYIQDMKRKGLITVKPAYSLHIIQTTRDGYYLGMPEHPGSITYFELPRHLFYEKMTQVAEN